MDDRDGSFLQLKRSRGLSASGLIQSPATVKDGQNIQRRYGMTPQQYQSLRQLDESIVHGNKSMVAVTPIVGSSRKDRFSKSQFGFSQPSHSRLSLLRDKAENFTMISDISDDFDLDETRNLLEPKTPAKFAEQMTTTMQCLPNEDPGLAATSSLYTDFKHCLQRHESASDVFELLAHYEEICTDNEMLLRKLLGVARPDPMMNSALDLMKMINDEKRTWRLIASLYSDRLKTEALEGSMLVDDMLEHESERKTADALFKENADVRQAQIVIDWLERNAADDLEDIADKVQHYSENVSWENTLYYLKQRELRGEKGSGDKNIVSQMDPDAPSRQRKPLADLDRADEVRLLKSMFSFIRAGKIEKAQDLCMYCGQPWRVMSLEGWQLYHDPNMDAITENGPAEVEGNPLRDLWKLASWAISQDETAHLYERAVYGSLCGNLKSMLNVCVSWEDFMWAHYRAMMDTMVEHELCHSPTLVARVRPECASGPVQMPESYWEQRANLSMPSQIFERIHALSNEIVRLEADTPFHVIQKFVILEDIAALIDSCHVWVTESVDDAMGENLPSVHPQLLRFLTHLILFLRTIGISMNEEKCEDILEAYIRYLASEERSAHLVANYTAALKQRKQVEVYSDFLKRIEDKNLRQEYLEMANEAGLDIPTITKTVVEDIRQQGDVDMTLRGEITMGGADRTVGDESFDPTLEPPMTRDDWRKIESLEWLVFDTSQRSEAIKQCNALMRSFLAGRKFTAAKEIFLKIPTGSVDVVYQEWKSKVPGSTPLPPEDENAVREHLCMQAYLSAKQSFTDWFKYFHHNKPKPVVEMSTSKLDRKYPNVVAHEHRQKQYEEQQSAWKETCKKMCASVRDKIYNVLLFPAGGWLVDIEPMKEDADEVQRRHHQLDILRRTCIPTLCHLLITALKNTDGMREECLHLADVMADEEFQLYKVFTKEEGRKILSRIQDIAIDLL